MLFKSFVLFTALLVALSMARADEVIIRKVLNEKFPEAQIVSVNKTPYSGLYEVYIDGTLIYTDATAKYILMGDIVELKSSTNLTQARLSVVALDGQRMSGMVPTDKQGKKTTLGDPNAGTQESLRHSPRHAAKPRPQATAINTAGQVAGRSSTANNADERTTQTECRQTLGFLAQRLPSFSLAELTTVRSAIIAQDVTQAIAGAKSQGYTAENAIKAAMAQAREFDRVSRESSQCAADVDALGASDEDFLAAMRQGKAPANCGGIRNACLCAGIVNRLGALGTRALAAEMQCFARSGKW